MEDSKEFYKSEGIEMTLNLKPLLLGMIQVNIQRILRDKGAMNRDVALALDDSFNEAIKDFVLSRSTDQVKPTTDKPQIESVRHKCKTTPFDGKIVSPKSEVSGITPEETLSKNWCVDCEQEKDSVHQLCFECAVSLGAVETHNAAIQKAIEILKRTEFRSDMANEINKMNIGELESLKHK